MRSDLQRMHQILHQSLHVPHFEQGGWVELENESEPDGIVLIKDAGGQIVMYMQRSVYEEILIHNPSYSE